jgi:sec-independent protein translocase protein TatB
MNLGLPEMIFILLVALLVFGPRKLPELGRQLGRAMTEFRRASNEFKWQLEEEMRQLEESDRRPRPHSPAASAGPGGAEAPSIAAPEGTIHSSRGTEAEASVSANGAAAPEAEVRPPKAPDA